MISQKEAYQYIYHSRSIILCDLFSKDEHLVVASQFFGESFIQSISNGNFLNTILASIRPPLVDGLRVDCGLEGCTSGNGRKSRGE